MLSVLGAYGIESFSALYRCCLAHVSAHCVVPVCVFHPAPYFVERLMR